MSKIKSIFYSSILFFSFWIFFFILKILTLFSFLYKKKKTSTSKSVLFLEITPIENAGYTYRSGKWAAIFEQNKISTSIKTLVADKKKYEHWLSNRNRSLFLAYCMLIRFFQIFSALKFDTIIVRRELLIYNDYGNLFFEKWLLKIHPNVILEFDDDIASAKREPRKVESLFGKLMLENGEKFLTACQLYPRLVVGSEYLKQLTIERTNKAENKILVIPTCVDYERFSPKIHDEKKSVISFGWIGGNQNLDLLNNIIAALNNISKDFSIELIVISGKKFEADTNFPIQNFEWKLNTEVELIKQIDIGLMPLKPTAIAKGKCGFKLIQYMGLGVVSIASGITANNDIVDDNENSFLVNDENYWENVIRKCLNRKNDFQKIGTLAAQKIAAHYSFEANKKKYLEFISQ